MGICPPLAVPRPWVGTVGVSTRMDFVLVELEDEASVAEFGADLIIHLLGLHNMIEGYLEQTFSEQ